MRDDGRGRRMLLYSVGRVVRWHARSHRQIWVMTTTGYLVSVSAVLFIEGWPRMGAFYFVLTAAAWIGIGVGQGYDLRRRRTPEPNVSVLDMRCMSDNPGRSAAS
jgi:hypothetical protein